MKLGDREVEKGTCIISWDAETAPNATVKFVPADAGRNYKLRKQSDGLYYYHPAGFVMVVK